MTLPRNILFPVDFSQGCRAVVPAVAAMAHDLKAAVTLLYAFDIGHPDLDLSPVLPEIGAIRAHLKEELDRFAIPGLEAARVRRQFVDGRAGGAIVRSAETLEAPLIMMPTRGHTRFRALLLGSVTASVLHDAACPVWTAAHREDSTPLAGGYRSLLCAIDMGPRTPEVLQAACDFSARFGAALHVVHCVPRIDPHLQSAPARRAHAILLAKARENYAQLCSKAGLTLPLEITEEKDVVSDLTAAIGRYGSDLLVIGRGVIQGPLGRLRTIAHELIRRSPCPVLSV